MEDQEFTPGALALYKGRPALVRLAGERLELELEGGQSVKVRPKDAALLHPGPLRSLGDLGRRPAGDMQTAWELLDSQTVDLAELAELAYGEFTPQTAWAAWEQVAEGLHFRGTPAAVTAVPPAEVERQQAARQAQAGEAAAWKAFTTRAGAGQFAEEDRRYLREVEDLALLRREGSRVLRELKRAETPPNAHALLLELGYWPAQFNPYPIRLGVSLQQPEIELPPLPAEERRDLTHLPALAIDDTGSSDPDDALSLEGERLWVHVADAAALIPPDSPADLEARARGANLYLPENTIHMLPEAATLQLALGLQEISPALSFGVDLTPEGEIARVEITPSWVRVQRLTYEEAQERLEEPLLAGLLRLARRYLGRRLNQGALRIDLPEVKLRVEDGQVLVQPVPNLDSRTLVREAMLMAGEATARLTLEHGIPAPYATQSPAEAVEPGAAPTAADGEPGLAEMFALRRAQNRGQVSSLPAPHSGTGLPAYVRATSPLRRYLDLVTHQQLRRFLNGTPLLSEQELIERVGASEAVTGLVAQAESLSRRHWTLIYFQQNPGWRGPGVLVDKRGRRGRVILPDLAYETWVSLRGDPPLGTVLQLRFSSQSLPELEASFRVEGSASP
jgi:exoribonuclease II